jgi:hypothetical protein
LWPDSCCIPLTKDELAIIAASRFDLFRLLVAFFGCFGFDLFLVFQKVNPN